MNNLVFTLHNLPPMPRNRSHQVTRNMIIKTKLCREFEKDLTKRLETFKDDFTNFKNSHTDQHYIRASYTIFTPRHLLFTQEGRISLKATDTDSHKVMRDTIYASLGLDDKLERDTRFFTPVSPDCDWHYIVNLSLRDISELTSLDMSLEKKLQEIENYL